MYSFNFAVFDQFQHDSECTSSSSKRQHQEEEKEDDEEWEYEEEGISDDVSVERGAARDRPYSILDQVGKSSKQHYSSLEKHINVMLVRHKEEYRKMFCKDLPSKFDDIDYALVNNHSFVSCVLHYFGNTAQTYTKEKNPLLSFKSADTLYSAFKTYFSRQKFPNHPMPRPFEERFWKFYRKNLLKWKEAQNVADGKGVDLIKSKEIANDEDRWTIFVMCVWHNLANAFMFGLLYNMLVQIGGRVSEASTILKSEIRAKVSDTGNSFDKSDLSKMI